MNLKNDDNFDDELWDEIPGSAFIPLGRRGREHILLRQCFIPSCSSKNGDKIHMIKKIEIESKKTNNKNIFEERQKYLIQCDVCENKFLLVFERHIDKSKTPDKNNVDKSVIFERVLASNALDNENYGEIGFIQVR